MKVFLTLLPVQFNDRFLFSIPHSNDLVQLSAEVQYPCAEPGVLSFEQQLHPPKVLTSDNAKPFIFDTPCLCHQLTAFAHSTQYQLKSLQQQYQRLENRMRKRGILENTLSLIQNMGASIRDSVHSVYDSTTKKLSDGAESIRWSILPLVMLITIPSLLLWSCSYFVSIVLSFNSQSWHKCGIRTSRLSSLVLF